MMSIPKNISTLKDRHCTYKVFIINIRTEYSTQVFK